MKTPEIRREYPVADIREISIDWNGFSYLVIYGRHINGWFIAIPNWNVCVEATEPTNIFYNANNLKKALDNTNAGDAIAMAIKGHWEGAKNANN